MGANLVFGLVAGSLSILSPCVLPLLPVLLGGALRQHRLAPVGLAAGLAASFTAVGLFLARAGFVLGIDGQTVRTGAAVDCILTARPAMMLVPCPVLEASAMPLTGAYFPV